MGYTVEHLNIAGTSLGSTNPVEPTWEKVLNEPHTVDYSLHLTDPLALLAKTRPYKTDFAFKRNDVTLIGGMHTQVGVDEGNYEELQVAGKSWLHYLERRRYPFNPADPTQYVRIPGEFPIRWVSMDIFQIVYDMVDEVIALNNSLPITHAATLAGITQHFEFGIPDMTSVLSHIQALADQAPGFDYDILPNKVLTLWTPQRGVTTPIFTANINPGTGNVSNWSYSNLGISGTRMMGFGPGIGGDRLPALRQNLTVEAAYRNFSATEDFGLTRDRVRLAAKTQNALNHAITEQIEFSMSFSDATVCEEIMDDVELGDVISVVGDTGYQNLNRHMRVIAISGTENREGDEIITLTVDANDVP